MSKLKWHDAGKWPTIPEQPECGACLGRGYVMGDGGEPSDCAECERRVYIAARTGVKPSMNPFNSRPSSQEETE